MRFEDTPELFGYGCGVGTCGDIQCHVCGTQYNQGENEREVFDGDSVTWTEFAGMTVCFCCFERIEREVWLRRRSILPWFKRRIDAAANELKQEQAALNTIVEDSP
jgi:hypothetical protein